MNIDTRKGRRDEKEECKKNKKIDTIVMIVVTERKKI